MKITTQFLRKNGACSEVIKEFEKHGDTTLSELLNEIIKKEYRIDWGNWLIVQCLLPEQYPQYTIFAISLLIGDLKKKDIVCVTLDKALNAAKRYITHPNIKNKGSVMYFIKRTFDIQVDIDEGDFTIQPAYRVAAAIRGLLVSLVPPTWKPKYAMLNLTSYIDNTFMCNVQRIKLLKYGLILAKKII